MRERAAISRSTMAEVDETTGFGELVWKYKRTVIKIDEIASGANLTENQNDDFDEKELVPSRRQRARRRGESTSKKNKNSNQLRSWQHFDPMTKLFQNFWSKLKWKSQKIYNFHFTFHLNSANELFISILRLIFSPFIEILILNSH